MMITMVGVRAHDARDDEEEINVEVSPYLAMKPIRLSYLDVKDHLMAGWSKVASTID